MVTRSGDTWYYDNFKMGWAKDPDDDGRIYCVFTDKDNEEVHMFPIAITLMEQFFDMGRQTSANVRIEVAGAHEMPKGGLRGA